MRNILRILQYAQLEQPAPDEAGRAYDAVADDYLRYADGNLDRLFDFDSRYAFADREVWRRIDSALVDLRTQGREHIRILDLGCGPGTWLLRTALHARALGFATIEARGIDISSELIALAQRSASRIHIAGIALDFAVQDLEAALASEPAEGCDLVLCLYGVLNHVSPSRHAAIVDRLAQVVAGHLVLTVRAAGSPPSVFVTGLEDALAYHQDHARDRLFVDLKDGRHLEFHSHLFTADEARTLFGHRFELRELVGLDLFHSRFKRDPNWHRDEPADERFESRLSGLERLCANDPEMIDHAAHILLSCTVRPRV
jgi:SAM-dependent methyltransferase